MLDTLFNPLGRIGPVKFRNAVLILVAIAAVFSLLPLVVPALAMASFASLLLLYPWAVIWVKRLHDAGKSGKWFMAIFAAWFVVNAIAGHFITAKFAPPIVPGDGPPDIWGTMLAQMQATAIPSTIAAVAISLAFALVINEELKSDPAQNEHGAPPGR